jgi:hypothetical protein
MSSYGVFEVDLFIKGKKFTHPVNLIKELNENILALTLFMRTNSPMTSSHAK